MTHDLRKRLTDQPVRASAPCRVDMGGTLDISTFYYPLAYLNPCTFNIAINMRTTVTLFPHEPGRVKISSRGFESAEFGMDDAPFNHPMGLMFAVAAYFHVHGVHIRIESNSPPKSALGGSSSAAVALVSAMIAAMSPVGEPRQVCPSRISLLAQGIEQSVAGVPCGLQDQLAAAYGGVNAWYWTPNPEGHVFRKKTAIPPSALKDFKHHFLLAYCGIGHVSKDINGGWVREFISGKFRKEWAEIVLCTKSFVDAIGKENYKEATRWMNRETGIRRKMTPDVLDDMGERLVDAARKARCGGRFTGAGGGGCLWAIGESDHIAALKPVWTSILSQRETASLLDVDVDLDAIKCEGLRFLI